MKRMEESGKSELFISCSKVKMVLFEEFAFAQEELLRETHSMLIPVRIEMRRQSSKKQHRYIDETKLNIKVKEFRPKRNAAAIAKLKIKEDTI